MLDSLKQKIAENKYIFLYAGKELEFLQLIAEAIEMNNKIEIWHSIKSFKSYQCVQFITSSEMDRLMEYYLLYEFSDKIFVISDSIQYGTIFNYIETGILTNQEVAKALLYKI